MSNANARTRAATITAATIGLAVAIAVIAYFNFGAVLAAIRPIGLLGFLAVVAAQVVLFVPLGFAWMLLTPGTTTPAPVFWWARLLREAASDVLPFSQLGGIVISIRGAVLGGVGPAQAFATCIVDMTVEIAAQIIYTLCGVALLAARLGGAGGGHQHLLWGLIGGMIIGCIVVGGMVFTQRSGLNLIEQMARRLAPSAAEQTSAIHEAVEASYSQPLRLWAGLAIHLAAWFGGAVGVWLILIFIGHPLPFISVVAIESLLFAIRNAAFIVPAGVGVQEGAYALIGPLFGLPAEAALALSLLKRARDISIGAPALLSWQFVESRRRLRDK